MIAEQRARLEASKLMLENERDLTDYFCGRSEEIARLTNEYLLRLRHDPHRTKGVKVVIGCPGIGKTSLLSKFAEAVQALGANPEKTGRRLGWIERAIRALGGLPGAERLREFSFAPLVIKTDVSTLRSKRELHQLLAQNAQPFRQGFTLGIESEDVRPEPFGTAARVLKRALVRLHPLIVLLVDEAQHADARNRDVFNSLHLENTGLPIMTVLAGLPNVETALKQAGVSRAIERAKFRLQRLQREDCAEAAERLFAGHEDALSIADREVWKTRAADISIRFPGHLNSMLYATLETALENDGALTGEALGRVEKKTRRARETYYAAQVRSVEMTLQERATVREILRRGERLENGGETWDGLETLTAEEVERTYGAEIDVEQKSGLVLDKMVHAGILQHTVAASTDSDEEPEPRYTVAIPSFKSWLLKNEDRRGAESP